MPKSHAALWLSAILISAILIACPFAAAAEDAGAPDDSDRRLNLTQARSYILNLINRDRATLSLKPVVLDGVASDAGQKHAEEMAECGYLSHWSLDGKKPDQRYTESGGTGYDMENAHIGFEGRAYTPDEKGEMVKLEPASEQTFSCQQLDEIESEFFNEKPPRDGHRRNIITPFHTGVGIGLSLAASRDVGSRLACCQEFVNNYGDFEAIPRELKLGQPLTIKGLLQPGVQPFSIDMRWEPYPKPMTTAELRKTYSYSPPEDRVITCFPQGFDSPFPILVNRSELGNEIMLTVVTDPHWKPGLYSVFVWARLPGENEPAIISLRTLTLDR